MKKLLIRLYVQCGEYPFNLNTLHTTNCENLAFAVNLYAAHFYDEFSFRDGADYYFNGGEIAVRVSSFRLLTDSEYDSLKNLLY